MSGRAGDAGLVSTADDLFAFSRLMLQRGVSRDGQRLVSEASVAAMTHDHLTTSQRGGGAPILLGRGWGYGLSVCLERSPEGVPSGAFGWNGGLGTSWVTDPAEDLTLILLTQQAFTSHVPPAINRDFWTTAYQALDD